MADTSQQFLNDLDKRLWTMADRLRSNLDAAVYKHAVLGLIFLKYVSDAFAERHQEIQQQLTDPNNEYYVDPADFDSPAEYNDFIAQELEERDYYTEKNVFWVPALARWQTIQGSAKLPPQTEIPIPYGEKETYKITSIGRLIDDALGEVERANPKLKNVLNKSYTQLQIDPTSLSGLIDLVATIPFRHGELGAKDILGHVYEYFLGEFALAEGKKGGQYFTPKSIVALVVEMIEPYQGRIYDPAMGSGGFFVQSERFIEAHGGRIGDLSVYGQESNPTTWRLAAMNMAIRGIDFNFGEEPANSFTNDQHPDLRADFVMANPPFNMKEWWDAKLEEDPRWAYGTPPPNNANFAWLQHMLYHLAPNGSLALLLANGSMSTSTKGEGEIRQRLIENDLVECMVALPGQLFTNTQIPACIWFLTKNKNARGDFRDRRNEVLFIDARNLGYMKDRVLRDFTIDDIAKIAGVFHAWKRAAHERPPGGDQAEASQSDDPAVTSRRSAAVYTDIPGFCKSATLDEIAGHDYVLTPGRYVGAPDEKDDGESFAEKMEMLTAELRGQFGESTRLEERIKRNLEGFGYDV